MRWRTALDLGRVSNLPTVWTNACAGVALAGGSVLDPRFPPLVVALSLFYVGGMYLNDGFDAEVDARERAERPIASGAVAASTVLALGFGMLAVGEGLLLVTGLALVDGTGLYPAASGLLLAAAIVLYDLWHKGNPLSPLLMGLCRVLVYLTAGFAVVTVLPWPLLGGAAALLCHLIGLTYVAKQENLDRVENLWPLLFLGAPPVYAAAMGAFDSLTGVTLWVAFMVLLGYGLRLLIQRGAGDVRRAVVTLIAGIALLDALLIAAAGGLGLAWIAAVGFVLTLVLQRYVAGT